MYIINETKNPRIETEDLIELTKLCCKITKLESDTLLFHFDCNPVISGKDRKTFGSTRAFERYIKIHFEDTKLNGISKYTVVVVRLFGTIIHEISHMKDHFKYLKGEIRGETLLKDNKLPYEEREQEKRASSMENYYFDKLLEENLSILNIIKGFFGIHNDYQKIHDILKKIASKL